MLTDIGEAQRLRMLDQRAENPPSAWLHPDRPVRSVLPARGQELLQRAVLVVQDPQGRVARPGDFTRCLKDTIQQNPLVELRRQSPTHIEQATNPRLLRRCAHSPRSLVANSGTMGLRSK